MIHCDDDRPTQFHNALVSAAMDCTGVDVPTLAGATGLDDGRIRHFLTTGRLYDPGDRDCGGLRYDKMSRIVGYFQNHFGLGMCAQGDGRNRIWQRREGLIPVGVHIARVMADVEAKYHAGKGGDQ